jgi:hypothetical protein
MIGFNAHLFFSYLINFIFTFIYHVYNYGFIQCFRLVENLLFSQYFYLLTQNTALIPKWITNSLWVTKYEYIWSYEYIWLLIYYGPGRWGQITLNNMFHCGRGYMNFCSHSTKQCHKSMDLPKMLVGISGRWVIAD